MHSDRTGREPPHRPSAPLRIGRIVGTASSVSLNAFDSYENTDYAHNTSLACYQVIFLDVTAGTWAANPLQVRARSPKPIIAATLGSGLSIGSIVQLREIAGRWWIEASAGSGRCDKVRFRIANMILNTMSAICYVHSVPAGFAITDVPGVSINPTPGQSSIIICDPQCSFFNEPPSSLAGRLGWAAYMQPLIPNTCQPYPYALQPQWEVFSLSCNLNASC